MNADCIKMSSPDSVKRDICLFAGSTSLHCPSGLRSCMKQAQDWEVPENGTTENAQEGES